MILYLSVKQKFPQLFLRNLFWLGYFGEKFVSSFHLIWMIFSSWVLGAIFGWQSLLPGYSCSKEFLNNTNLIINFSFFQVQCFYKKNDETKHWQKMKKLTFSASYKPRRNLKNSKSLVNLYGKIQYTHCFRTNAKSSKRANVSTGK